MQEIVKYHNDFNKIKLPSFTELEQNLLFSLITKIKEQNGKSFYFGNSEIRDMIEDKYRYNNNEIVKLCKSLKEKFFKADFTILQKEILNIDNSQKEVLAEKTINLFIEFAIYYDKDVGDFHPEPMISNFMGITLEINPKFAYLINEITKNFTAFELVEFIALSGKYTKTLYRLLKQYRNTGIARFEWEEFKRIMDIPEKLKMCDIDKDILKPAMKELTKERNLFDQDRVCFKNLAYEKEKAKGTRGRGGKVIGIVFTFKPETKNADKEKIQELEKENKALEQNNLENENEFYKKQNQDLVRMLGMNQEFGNLVGRSFYNEQGEVIKIQNAYKKINGEIETIFKNSESEKIFTKNFENEKHFRNYLKKFEVF